MRICRELIRGSERAFLSVFVVTGVRKQDDSTGEQIMNGQLFPTLLSVFSPLILGMAIEKFIFPVV